MSTTVMAACWPLQMPPTPKAVLMSLADNANDHGECWPSISTICERTCFGKTAVIEAIRWLESDGVLVADRTNGRHTRYTIVPNLDLFNRSAKRTGPPAEPVREANRTGASGEPDRSARRTLTVKNHQELKDQKQQRDSKRGSRLPDGWAPSEAVREWARSEFPTVNLDVVLAEFADYWRSVPGQRGTKLDWDATFRNRVREVAARQSRNPRGTHRESAADRVARRNAEAERGRAGVVIEGEFDAR